MSENKKPSGLKFSPWWISGAVIFMLILLNIFNSNTSLDPAVISSAKLTQLINNGQIDKVIIFNKTHAEAYLTAVAMKDKANKKVTKDPLFGGVNKGPHYTTEIADAQNFEKELAKAVQENKLKDYDFKVKDDWSGLIFQILPFVVIIGIWLYLMRRMSGGAGGGGGQIFNIGKSRAKLFDEKSEVKTTFKDVAGLEGAKEEVQEIVEFLKNPEKYTVLGGKIPKGALLVGPPGTGKTL